MSMTYEKPVISVDAGMAEGVYAASGSSSSKLNISVANTMKWSDTSGQRDFSIDTTGVEDGKNSITLYFNSAISSCWGGGASVNVSGQTARLTWWSMPKETITMSVQVSSSNVEDLKITGYDIN